MEKEQVSNANQIKFGAIFSYASVIVNIIIGLLYTPWLINVIGKSDYALYALSTSIVGYFLLDLGLGSAISKNIAKYNALGDRKQIGNLLGVSLKIYIVLTILLTLVLIVLWLLIEVIYTGLTPNELAKFEIVYFITAVCAIISFPLSPVNDILVGYGRFVIPKLIDLVFRVGSTCFIIIALIMGYKLFTVVTINSFVAVSINLTKLIYIKHRISPDINYKHRDKVLLKSIFTFSSWVAVTTIADRLILNVSPTVLAILSDSSQITMFSLAMTIEGMIWTLSYALNGLFLTRVTKIVESKNDSEEDLTILMIKVGRIQLSIVGFVIIGFALMGQEFIPLWIGEGYSEVYWTAMFIIVPCMLILTQDIGRTILVVKDKVKYRALVFVATAALSLILSFILIPSFGAIGAAIGIFVANSLGKGLIMNIIYNYKLKLNMIRFYKECYLTMSIPFMVIILVGVIAQQILTLNNLLIFAVKAMLLLAIYAVSLWLWGYNKEEKLILKGLFSR